MELSRSVKKIISVFLALAAAFTAAFVILPPSEASALSTIKHSVSYSGDKVKLKLKPQKSTDRIYYTTDGSVPSTKSRKYTKVLSSSARALVRAVEYNKSGKKVASLKITIIPRVQKIVFTSEISGSVEHLTLSTATPGAEIYFTADGSEPTKDSTKYTGRFICPEGLVIKARAYKSGMQDSRIYTYQNGGDTTSDSSGQGSYAEQVAAIVNKNRAAVGAEALTLDSELCKAADVRAKELYTLYSHTRPNGTDCKTILDEYGISRMASGENIAYGMNKLYTAKEVVDLWMDSTGHRENILRTMFRKIGVGRYETGSYVFWVQIFTD